MGMQKKKKKKISAFTLVEVLVAMLVLAIGLLGLAGITIVVLKSNTLSQQISEATTIGADLMDTLKLQAFSSIPDCSGANVISSACPSCGLLCQGGLGDSSLDDYWPSTSNQTCGVAGVLGTNAMTFDLIESNLTGGSDFSGNTSICSLTASNIPTGQYLRYFRTYQPGSDSSERAMVVVILWKGKNDKIYNIHLSTTRRN